MAQKILLVEDENLTRKTLGQFLRDEGYEVVEASDGADALDVLVTQRFDLVITDFVLPHVDGLRLTDAINETWPDIPVVLVTGYLSVPAGKALLHDKAEVVSKPIKFDDFLATVQRMIGPKPQS
jgi:CheY-like chemotaxis protein